MPDKRTRLVARDPYGVVHRGVVDLARGSEQPIKTKCGALYFMGLIDPTEALTCLACAATT